MSHLPLRLSPAPDLPSAAVKSTRRSPHSGTCIALAHDATAESLSYGITSDDVAQVYLSPTPYNDAFEEVLDLQKFDLSRHRAAGMAFLPQDNRLILANMVASTPGARIARWRTRLRGAWLLSINGNPVQMLTDVHDVFDNLSLR